MKPVTTSIVEAATHNSLAPAVCGEDDTMTYGLLRRRLSAVCGILADRQPPPQTLVFLNMHSENLRLIAALAAMHLGLVPIMIGRLDEVNEPPRPGLVIGSANHEDRIDKSMPCDAVIDLPAIDRMSGLGALPPWFARDDDALYYISSTTGSTGKPKLVSSTLGMVSRRLWAAQHMQFAPGEHLMSTIRPRTNYGFLTSHHAMVAGACLVRVASNPLKSLALINLFSVSRLLTVPQQLTVFMNLMQRHEVRCPTVRHISISGSLFTRALIRRVESMFDAEIEVVYGASEVGSIARGRIDSTNFQPGYVGEVMPALQLKAESANPDAPAALELVDRVGVLALGAGLSESGQPARYPLPDLGAYRDGRLYISGRGDDVFNFSGNKIAFSRIEAALRLDERVSEVAITHATASGELPGLVVGLITAEGAVLDVDGIWQALKRNLPSIANAREVVQFVPIRAVPLNAGGKLDRQALLELAQGTPRH